jgi:pimeloyl-ACP methyl ester carboxylesterase
MVDRRVIKTRDGRRLAIEVSGAPDGHPVFLLHGTPGSRSGPKPRSIVLYRLGIKLITYDRPGYGHSSRIPGRTVAQAADDVAAIADKLRINRFYVVGRSGGGPHALACAAILGHRVIRTAVLVGIAPSDAQELDWFEGMAESNVVEYSAAEGDHVELMRLLEGRADDVRKDPENMVQFLQSQMADDDRRIVGDMGIRRLLHNTYIEALQGGAEGWIDDALAFKKPWGFPLEAINTPVLLWHGDKDRFSPVSHARWLYNKLPNAELKVESGAAHFGAIEILPQLLNWLTDPALAGNLHRVGSDQGRP